eukprot:13276166-Ditylum_brightwellii.AAC.2
MSTLTEQKCDGNEVGNDMLGSAAPLVPQCGYGGFSNIAPFVVSSTLANDIIPLPPVEKLVAAQPSCQKLKPLVRKHAC